MDQAVTAVLEDDDARTREVAVNAVGRSLEVASAVRRTEVARRAGYQVGACGIAVGPFRADP
jgi:hypothetical protein